jgi:hypothetical protein
MATTAFGMCFGLGALALVGAGAGACSGKVEDGTVPGMSGGNPSATGGTPTTTATCTNAASLAPARLWRITDQQYGNVVADVFGVRVPPEVTEPDTKPADFTNLAGVSTVEARAVTAYETAARLAARAAVAANLGVFLPCGATAPSDACVDQFIRNRVARAFGRSLTTTEVQDLMAIYRSGLPDGPATGIRLVIEAALQAPSFLYRTEIGENAATAVGGKVKLTAHEVATAISFALRDSVADDIMWQKAEAGTLLTPSVLAAEIDRLLASRDVQANLSYKAGFWLGVERLHGTEKDASLFPEFNDDVKQSLYDSARLFVQDVFAHGTVSDLLTSRRMFVNASLARLYGIPGVTGNDLRPVEVAGAERSSGILTQPAVLAAFSRPDKGDPIHRGLFIYYSLACAADIPAPPKDALAIAATFPKDATERELAGLRAANSGCNTCHALFDPLGLTTERYDPIGRYRETDARGTIDASATLRGLGADLDGPVSGLPDLVAKLEVGRRVSDCAATNLAVFVLGRTFSADNACSLQPAKDRFQATGSFTDYYRALLTSPAFLTRDIEQ